MSNELTKAAGSELANIDPAMLAMMAGNDAQSDFSGDDLAIPRIRILQTLSKELKKNRPEFVEEANVGDIYNSVSGICTPGNDGLFVFYCAYKQCYVEWEDRKFVAVYDKIEGQKMMQTAVKDDKGKMKLPNGNDIVKTAEYAVVFSADGGDNWQQAIINMSSTQLKKSSNWNSQVDSMKIGGNRAVQWARCYKFTTQFEDNEHGDWYGWKIEPGSFISEFDNATDLFKMCKDTRESYLGMTLKVQGHDDEYVLNDDDI